MTVIAPQHHHDASVAFIQQSVPLHDKNWFGTGGLAHFFCEPTSSDQFVYAIQFAHAQEIPVMILGHGANVLISDTGFSGLIIRPHLTAIHLHAEDSTVLVTAESGVAIADLINFCFAHHCIGLEEFSGIPGTVGGALFINLHYFEFLIEKFLLHAQLIDAQSGAITTVSKEWFNFSYNYSTLQQRTHYLVSATFVVKKATDTELNFARGRQYEIIRHRARRYPTSGTCGSFFRIFHENEVSLIIAGKKMVFVGYYLDKIGVKGQLRIGNAMVSYQHANMIVNLGNATSNDIITLAYTMQELVYQHFQILPQPECELIGFDPYPLMK